MAFCWPIQLLSSAAYGRHPNRDGNSILRADKQLQFTAVPSLPHFPLFPWRVFYFFFLARISCSLSPFRQFPVEQIVTRKVYRYTMYLPVQQSRRPHTSREADTSTDQPIDSFRCSQCRMAVWRRAESREREWRKCIGRLGFVSIECYTCTTLVLSSQVITTRHTTKLWKQSFLFRLESSVPSISSSAHLPQRRHTFLYWLTCTGFDMVRARALALHQIDDKVNGK